MRDYGCLLEDGTELKVADLPDYDLHEMLAEGFNVYDATVGENAIRERLEIEVLIRRMGFR